MKFFIISDTHGSLDETYEVYKTLKDIDLILHLGDCQPDGIEIGKVLGVDVVAVKGNMDGSHDSSDFNIVETEFGKLFLAHGHMQGVKSDYQKISYAAMEHDCVAAVFGHTHVPHFSQDKGIYLINPGSIAMPRPGFSGSYALVETSPDDLTCTLIYLEPQKKTSPNTQGGKPAVTGGYLKNLLNNSDRF